MDHDDRGMRLKAGATTVEVAALAPDLFRVGMLPESQPPRYDSEAIAKQDWEPVAVKVSGEEVLTLSTEAATHHSPKKHLLHSAARTSLPPSFHRSPPPLAP